MSLPEYSDDQPPSYDTLFGKIKQAKQNSDGNVAFIRNVASITTNSLAYIVSLVLLLGVPISCTVIGAFYLYDCPAQRYIPIYLVVFGPFAFIKDLFNIILSFRARKNEKVDDQQKRPNPVDSLISCFLFAWFICGNVWIYGTYHKFQSTDPTTDNYCHPTLFYFSFWLLNATYILIGLMCLCCCACCLYICCIVKTSE